MYLHQYVDVILTTTQEFFSVKLIVISIRTVIIILKYDDEWFTFNL